MLIRRNQRRSSRRHVRVDCQVVRERDFRLVGKRTLDLSPDGLLVRMEAGQALEVGEPVVLTFRTTELGLWFDAEAVVTRIVHGRRPEDRGRAFALWFVDFPWVSRLILRGHLRRVPPVVPARSPRVDYAATVRAFDT